MNTIAKCGPNLFYVDGEIDGEIYLRPIVDGIACWPGIRVDADELRQLPVEYIEAQDEIA